MTLQGDVLDQPALGAVIEGVTWEAIKGHLGDHRVEDKEERHDGRQRLLEECGLALRLIAWFEMEAAAVIILFALRALSTGPRTRSVMLLLLLRAAQDHEHDDNNEHQR